MEEATWCITSPADSVYSVVVWEVQVTRSLGEKGDKVLGAQVSFDNAFDNELRERAKKAWRAFHVLEDLHFQVCPHRAEVKLLWVLLRSSLFFCAGSWNLLGTKCADVFVLQQFMFCKMLRIRYAMDDTPSYCVRSARAV